VLVWAALTLGWVGPAGAARAATDGASCNPVSAAQLHSILGLPNSMQARNTVGNAGGADDLECYGVAWTGTPPTTFQAAIQTARSGNGAAFGIEAWLPNESSPDVQTWKDRDYDKLTGELGQEAEDFPGLFTKSSGWTSKTITPPRFGYQASGFVVSVGSGPAKGLVAAIGCWWNDKAYTAVCLLDEEGAGRPVASHLNALAKIAVPKVL
jgi:hypothetical protein